MSEDEINATQLAEEVMRCKLKTWEKIEDILEHIGSETLRVDGIEATMVDIKESLKEHEKQRADFSQEIRGDIARLNKWAEVHDKKEMEKYDNIINALEDLTSTIGKVQHETDDNSKALMQNKIEEEKQIAIQEALDNRDAPYKEYKKKAIFVVVTMITGAVMTGLWKLIMLVSHLDTVMLGG